MSETISAPPPAAPIAAPAPAPVEAVAPVVAPVTTPEPSPAPTPAPEAAPVAPTEAPSLLGEALKPADATVEPAPAPDATQNVEGQSAEPAPPPTYEPFTVPEGVTLESERLGEFTGLLSQFETETKADHGKMQALGQELLNRHIQGVQQAIQTARQADMAAFETVKTQWKDAVIADPELGGNRLQTTLDSARNFIRTHGGSEAEQGEFIRAIDEAGLGNHPAVIRILARAGSSMSEGRPLTASAPAPAPTSRVEKMYGRK
jgi:uncharacterized membrane protein